MRNYKVDRITAVEVGTARFELPDGFSIPTKRQPTAEEWEQLEFAWLTAKHVKSIAIVLAYGAVCVRYYFAHRNLPGERQICPPQIGWLFALLSLAPVMGMFVTNEVRNWTVNRVPWG